MKRHALFPTLALLAMALVSACVGTDPVTPIEELEVPTALSVAYTDACWGQATAAFAQMGEMGAHASQQPTPRLGLGNLARLLFDDGVLDEPTLQALAAYLVSIDPELSVDACM